MEAKKRKILFVITKSNWGGAQRYVYDLATNLPKDRFETVVSLGGNGPLKTKLEESGIRTISIPLLKRDISIFKEIKVFFKLIALYKKEMPDVIHLNSSKIGGLGSLSGRIYRLFAKHLPIIIFTAHGFAFNENRSLLSKFAIKASYFFIMACCDKTIAVSDSIKDQVRHWPFISKKIVVIKNTIPVMNFLEKEPARNFLQSKISASLLNTERLWLGTIGELHPIKGQSFLIEALVELKKEFANFVFIIIGEGEERRKLEQQIEDLQMKDNIFLVGHIDEASKYLKAFDIFILPSISEALGYVILEASQAHIPIISSRVGGIPEVLEDGKMGLLVEPGNGSEIEKALKTLINSPEKRLLFSKSLAENTSTNSFANMIKLTIESYI